LSDNFQVGEAWQRLVSDSNEISWIACGYSATAPNNLLLKEEGTGGMPEFISKLTDDEIIWGAFKVVGVGEL
jgi:hypothetical protein